MLEAASTKQDVSYSMLKMVVNKETFIASKIEFYDKVGRLWKVMTNSSVENVEGKWVAKEIKMVNMQDQHTTQLKMIKISFDQNLSDDVFTQRNMQK